MLRDVQVFTQPAAHGQATARPLMADRYNAAWIRMPLTTPALSVSHLRKVYRSGTVGVSDLSLEIAPGDFFGFLGPNGAGKSTTIHCVTGIATPTSGTIEIFGVDAVKDYREARKLIG